MQGVEAASCFAVALHRLGGARELQRKVRVCIRREKVV